MRLFRVFSPLVAAAASFLLIPSTGSAQQTIQLVNDNAPTQPDSNVWVLFVGNPANVSAGGSTISGLRDLAIPTCSVSTNQVAGATTVQSALLTNPTQTIPAVPFPIQFISGLNQGAQVQVTAYDATTGTLTVQSDPTVTSPTWPLQAQTGGDQFVVGAYSQKLSTLPTSSTIVSALSGQTQNVYNVLANTLDAGVIYISYGQLTYLGAAPAISTSKVPFQTVELTTGTGGGATTSDLTVIDYFSIPIQIQSINQSDASVADTRTFYFNKSTIVSGLTSIGATLNSGNALYLGPGQITAANNGSPSPFPSFAGYLESLKSQSFTIAGAQNFGAPNPTVVYGINVGGNYQSTYGYTTAVNEDTHGNFSIVMTPQPGQNTFTSPPSYFPDPANVSNITVNLPAATSLNPVGYDAVIYGAILDSSSFTINLTSGTLTPPTFSGPFAVTTGTSSTSFNSSAVAALDTPVLGGFFVNFTSGADSGQTAPITSVDATGTFTVGAGLTSTPAAGDQFQVLFAATAPGTKNFFSAAPISALNFLAPFNVTFLTGANAGSTATVAAIDSAGNITLKTNLTNSVSAGDQFSVSVASSDVFTQLYTNSTYSWAVSELLAGLNFGFPGSPTAGNTSAGWYAAFPQQFPYGLARGAHNDGFYNPWSAYFYNASDAYGFAFSDRIAPSPLMTTTPASQNLQITVLPESQIDAPLAVVTNATPSELDVSWAAVAGVTYSVTTLPPINAGQITVNSSLGTATLTGLNPGTPYKISVQGSIAAGSGLGAQTSYELPLYAETTGSVAATAGSLPFVTSFSWAGTTSITASQYNVFVNGSQLTLTGNPPSTPSNMSLPLSGGATAQNLYVVDFQNPSTGTSVYKGIIDVGFATGATNEFSITGTPTLYGSMSSSNPASRGLAPAPAAGPYIISPPNLNLGMAFNPEVRKEFSPVATPTPAPTPNPTPTPPPTPQASVNGKKKVTTDKSNVKIKGTSVGGSMYVKYKNKSGKTLTKKISVSASGSWTFKYSPTVNQSTLKFYAQNSAGTKSSEIKYTIVSTKF